MTVNTSEPFTSARTEPTPRWKAPGDSTVLDLVNVLLLRRRLIVAIVLICGTLSLLIALVLPPKYVAITTFVPDVGSAQSRLGGLGSLSGLASVAGQFGFSLGGDPSRSPRFYADVAKSREVLERVLLTRFPVSPSSGDSAPLLTIMGVRGRDSTDRLQRGTRKLARQVTAAVNSQTGIVEIEIAWKDPMLSALIANRLVELLNEFNAHTRQTRASERRRFVEERVADGERNLRHAEDELKQFYEKNRSWQQAPKLVFEEGRLRRQVEVQQELYLTLRREYETSRIEEVNDTPILTVIDIATPPRRRSQPTPLVLTVLGILLGGVLGIFSAFGVEYAGRLRLEDGEDYRHFRSLVQDTRRDLADLIRKKRE